MYYNKVLKIWVIDQVDYFLISAIIGSLTARYLKDYLSEKSSMERLKKSLIKKSEFRDPNSLRRLVSKKSKNQAIYRFALINRGGQNFEYSDFEQKLFKVSYNLADQIRKVVEKLAAYLKQQELKGVLNIFFKNGRLLLELILVNCNINLTYTFFLVSPEGQLTAQAIAITAASGGTTGFLLSWYSVGAFLVSPPLLISILGLRSIFQQTLNQAEYRHFKKMLDELLSKNKDLTETLKTVLNDEEPPFTNIKRKEAFPIDADAILRHDFESTSDQSFEEFIKNQIKDEFGLVENPTDKQLQDIIQGRTPRKKGKTVFFQDFIEEMEDSVTDFSEADILDAEIIEPIKSEKIK